MYICESLQDVYKVLGRSLLDKGDIVSPRGKETREILNANFMIENPRARLVYNKDRNFSLIYAIVESLLLVQKTRDLKYFAAFNKNISQFSDDGYELYGAYGMRVSRSIWEVIDKLTKDKDSRQAYVPIFKIKDAAKQTKDLPCTMGLHFMIRNNKLNLHAYMRSNDIMWGTQYDVFMFTMLQEIVASTLGIDVGNYYHNATSLHVYKDYYEKLENMISDSTEHSFSIGYDLKQWEHIGQWYKKKVNGNDFYKNADPKVITPNNPFFRLLLNEFDYRKGVPAEKLFYTDSIEWAAPFTQRWWKGNE